MASPLYLNGLGLWSPTFPSAATWARRSPVQALLPSASLFAPNTRRRASLLTRAASDAFQQAATEGGADLATVRTVYTSAYGEITTTIEMLQQMATEPEGLPSPTRFHNSVHNTSAGYVSIATGDKSFSSSLAAGPRSLAMGFVEAAAVLAEAPGELMLVALDEPPPAPFAPPRPFPLLAAAFHLSSAPTAKSKAKLSNLRPGASAASAPPPFERHPCAAALLLVDAVLGRKATLVPLSLTGDDWVLDVEPL